MTVDPSEERVDFKTAAAVRGDRGFLFGTARWYLAERVMIEYVVQLTEDATCITPAHHDRLRTVGFDDQGILQITEETTEGTKQTNVSIGQLTKLAAELRSSVAGFKV